MHRYKRLAQKKRKIICKKKRFKKSGWVNAWSGFGDSMYRVSVSLHFIPLWVRSPWTLTGFRGWFSRAPGFRPIWQWKSWGVALTFLYLWVLALMLTHTLLVRSPVFLFLLLLFLLWRSSVNMGTLLGSWGLYRWDRVLGEWLLGSCCQRWSFWCSLKKINQKKKKKVRNKKRK